MESKEKTVRQRAYECIRRMVVNGELAAGDRLSTPELARQLGISRTPVREAISRLVSEGLLHEAPGHGASIREPSPEQLIQLYDLRAILESYAAAEAARFINAEELEQLDECCLRWLTLLRQIRRAPDKRFTDDQRQRWISVDEQFHRIIYSATQNELLFKTLTDMRLMSRTLDLRRLDRQGSIDLSGASRSYRQHASLVRALRSGDAELAADLMRRQILDGKRGHLAHFEVAVTREPPRIVPSADLPHSDGG